MQSAKILIVDDELIMRESLAGWLERDGHEVEKAASGEEALKILKESRFDILLVDIKMEGMSGLDVLKQVKESDPDVEIVMITAYGSIATAIEAMKNGAYEYLLKPFEPDELGILIEKITDRIKSCSTIPIDSIRTINISYQVVIASKVVFHILQFLTVTDWNSCKNRNRKHG